MAESLCAKLSAMNVDGAVRSLRATRQFMDTPIDDDLVTKWVNAARWCGSSKNSQPWRFVVVRDRGVLRQLSTKGDFASHIGRCQLAIVFVALPTAYPFSMAFDLGRVAQSLMLLAHDDGIGSCVAVFEPRENVIAVGTLVCSPKEWSAELAVGFGYRRGDSGSESRGVAFPPSGATRPARLPTDDLLYWETFPKGSDAIR